MQYGYNPDLKYHNGQSISARPDHQEFTSLKSYTVEDVKMIEKRIKDAIDSGYVIGVSIRPGPFQLPPTNCVWRLVD